MSSLGTTGGSDGRGGSSSSRAGSRSPLLDTIMGRSLRNVA